MPGRFFAMTDDYDSKDDWHKSYAEALRIVRERMLAGGPGWTPHKYHPLCNGCCKPIDFLSPNNYIRDSDNHERRDMSEHTEWCRRHFASMKDGGAWAIPRSGVIFRRRGNELVLTERMPHDPAMPITAEQLLAQQRDEFLINKREFALAGVTVVDDTKLGDI